MTSVPSLAPIGTWQAAGLLIILERVGKAIRNPPRDVTLSQAARQVGGYGWAFGLHEAFDQFGARCLGRSQSRRFLRARASIIAPSLS
jgi:hypothetical protein